MNAKTTIALLIIAGALGALLYVTEITGTPDAPDPGAAETGDRVFDEGAIESDATASITITPAGEPAAKFVRDGDGWKQVEPVAFAANGFAIDRIIDAAGALRSSSTFTPSDKQYTLKEFGLDPPRTVVTIEPRDGDAVTLALGKTSAAGRAYVIADYDAATAGADTPVAIVDERVHRQIPDNPLTDLRDRKLPSIDAGAAASITLTRGDTAIELTKVGGEWKLGKAKQRAGSGAVATLAGAFAAASVHEFTADSPDDLAVYGLDKPGAVLTVTAAAPAQPANKAENTEDSHSEILKKVGMSSRSHTLRIGSATDLSKTHFFASLDDTPAVFTVPKAAADRLLVAVDDLRDPRLTPLSQVDLTAVTVKGNGGIVRFAKTEGRWKFGEPGPGFEVDGETTNDAIASLFDAKAQSYADTTLKDLGAPTATIELSAIGKDPQKLVIYANDDGTAMTLFAGETIGRVVDAAPLKTLLSPAWAYRDRTILEATMDTIAKATIDRTGDWPAKYTIARKPPQAEGPSPTEQPEQGADAWELEGLDQQRVGAVLGSLAPLRAEAWRAEPIAKNARNVATVNIELVDGKSQTLRIDLDAGIGMIDGVSQAFVLREGSADAFAAEIRDTRVLALDINQIASIVTHGVTVKRSEEGKFTLDGDGKLDEAKAAALFGAVASLRADRFTDVRKDASPGFTLLVTMRDGTKHEITGVGALVWTGEKWFMVTETTASALTADVRVGVN